MAHCVENKVSDGGHPCAAKPDLRGQPIEVQNRKHTENAQKENGLGF